jgi:glycosyltransferase involved in cell wall biosynthesis
MRILFLAPQPFFTERGTPIAVRAAVESLARQGHAVDLVTFHEGSDVDMPGVNHLRIAQPGKITGVPIGLSGKKLICDLWLAIAALRLLRAGRYDVVHAVEEAVFIGLALRPLTGARLVYDVDSIMSDQIADKLPRARALGGLVRMAEGWAFRRSDLVLAVCPSIAERARAQAKATPIHVLPDIAVPPIAAPRAAERLRDQVPDDRPIVLYVGNLESYQGVDLLLEAQALVPPAERSMLVMIGGTPASVAACSRQAAALGIDGDVRLLGPRPIEHLQHYLAQADVLCSPRRGGINTPMKIFSYMSSGKAILATDIESHRQVLDGDSALLVPVTPAAIADGLLKLQRDGALRKALGTKAAALARTEFSPERFEARLEDAYRTLAPPARGRLTPARAA